MSEKMDDPNLMKTEVLTVNEHTWLEAQPHHARESSAATDLDAA